MVLNDEKIPILFVKGLQVTLLSLRELVELGYSANFSRNNSYLVSPSSAEFPSKISLSTSRSGLYILEEQAYNVEISDPHRTYGHISDGTLDRMGLKQSHGLKFCSICAQAKLISRGYFKTKKPVTEISKTEIKSVFNVDTRRPFPLSLRNNKYLTNVLDFGSSHLDVIPTPRKANVDVEVMKLLKTHPKDILVIKNDVGELCTNIFSEFCDQYGKFQQQVTIPGESNLNARVERSHRTIGECIRCLLLDSNLPNVFWDFAAQHSA
jgi:hypothetical protein